MQFRPVIALTFTQTDAASSMNGMNAHHTSGTASATQSNRDIQGFIVNMRKR